MRIFTLVCLILFILSACNTATERSATGALVEDRPKLEMRFLQKVQGIRDSLIELDQNAALKDEHVAAFNKFVTDSLTAISGWEFIVGQIDDNEYSSNTFAKANWDLVNNPVYNLELIGMTQYDPSVDTLNISNSVGFVATVLKQPNEAGQQQLVKQIKNLNKGDTVIVSGTITHLDKDGKVNFLDMHTSYSYFSFDLLLTDIKKKPARK